MSHSTAHQVVRCAVDRGDLPRIKTQTCVDCGAPASDYDHRDYNKPLDVEPTCRSCNLARGPAIPQGCSTYSHKSGVGFVVAANGVIRVGIEAIDFGNYEQSPTEPTTI